MDIELVYNDRNHFVRLTIAKDRVTLKVPTAIDLRLLAFLSKFARAASEKAQPTLEWTLRGVWEDPNRLWMRTNGGESVLFEASDLGLTPFEGDEALQTMCNY